MSATTEREPKRRARALRVPASAILLAAGLALNWAAAAGAHPAGSRDAVRATAAARVASLGLHARTRHRADPRAGRHRRALRARRRRLLRARAAAAQPAANLAPCEIALEGLCGHVDVPLDRDHPAAGTIAIAFVVFRHSDPGPAAGTIFVTEGGSGFSAINNMQGPYRDLFGPLLADHDLVLVDYRGEGQSGAIDCPALQQDAPDIYASAIACADQLGGAGDLYGSDDVAEDVEAVRAALGVERFDYYGGSYAGVDISAYAVRHPEHLRSVILDSPVSAIAQDPWFTSSAGAVVRAVDLMCRRSGGCSAAGNDPADALAQLTERLRRRPVDGVGLDAEGAAHTLHVDESTLVKDVQAGGTPVQGDIAAVETALRRGDTAPLLRIAAETDIPLLTFGEPDPTIFSAGENIARFCVDFAFPWDKTATPAQRRAQFDQARAALAPDRFAPFSVDAWAVPPPNGVFPDPCIGWPAPAHERARPVPDGATVPGVPALILTGDLDTIVPREDSRRLTRLFPDSTVVDLAGATHHVAFSPRFDCAAELINRFIASLDAGDTRCAGDAFAFPAPARFPLRTADAVPARVDPAGSDRSRGRDRRAAGAAAATVVDALLHAFRQREPGTGPGLRGGTFTAAFDGTTLSVALDAARLAGDLAVTGTGTEDFTTDTLDATIDLAGAATGRLHIEGLWFDPDASDLSVEGTIDGRRVALLVPAT